MDIETLHKNIGALENPVLIATELGFFISDGCSDGSLSLYEAFLLKDTELNLLQQGATQPAWNHGLGMSHLLGLERLFALATYFSDARLADTILERVSETIPILREKREHFSIDAGQLLLDGKKSEAIKLLRLNNSKTQSFNDGPFIDEVFPYKFIDVEDKVLAGKFDDNKEVSESIADLLVEIMVKNG